MNNSVTTRDNPGARRFEMDVDGAQAIAMYEIDGQTITFTHIKVPETLGEDAASARNSSAPRCSPRAIAAWMWCRNARCSPRTCGRIKRRRIC